MPENFDVWDLTTFEQNGELCSRKMCETIYKVDHAQSLEWNF